MSLFESVWVKLACQRCGRVHESVVRFRSFSGVPDGEYELLEVVPQGVGLSRWEVWEGNADRYCWECNKKWSQAQIYAAYDALGELIEKGLVTVRAKGSADPIPASATKEYADKYMKELGGGLEVTMPYFEELDLTVGDKPYNPDDLLNFIETDQSKVIAADEIWSEFLNLIGPLLEERMSKDGWVADGSTWEEFRVSLDDDRRIVVEDMQGRRLTRDGARIAQ